MTNEELAVLIQNGETDKRYDLWTQVERLAACWANQYARKLTTMGAVTNEQDAVDDLFNGCGYPAMCAAVEAFDPERGNFSTLFHFYFMREARGLLGWRSTKRDAMCGAVSLNQPLSEDEGGGELQDTIVDPTDAYTDTERLIWLSQLRGTMQSALDGLPAQAADVICEHYYEQRTLKEIGQSHGMSAERARRIETKAFRCLRGSRKGGELAHFLYTDGDVRAAGLYGSGLAAFRRTGERATECTALRMLEGKPI